MKSKNIYWSISKITTKKRNIKNGHKGVVIWLTGLSASGKSTIAIELENILFKMGCQTYILDGDNIRHGISSDLNFSSKERRENVRRTGEIAKLFCDAGNIVIVALISPYRADRNRVRNILQKNEFIEVFIDCPLKICSERDPKGLYKLAILKKINNFTGINSAYEPPKYPEIIIKSNKLTINESVNSIIKFIKKNRIIK